MTADEIEYDEFGNRKHRRRYKPAVWSKLQRHGMARVVENVSAPIEFRLWAYVTTQVGIAGHAEFENGELERVLTKVNKSTGETGPYDKRSINRAIATGVADELYAQGSNRRCIIVNAAMLDVDQDYLRNDDGEPIVVCDEHGHYNHWLDDCWVTTNESGAWVQAA